MFSGRLSSLFSGVLHLLVICTSVRSQEVFTSISGRRVPVHLVQQHFAKQLDLSDDKKKLIYELTEEQVLLGPDLHLDLRTEARPVKTSSSYPFTVTLNGKPREAPSAKVSTLRAKAYDVIVEDETGSVLSVTGNGIVLAPLHRAAFPGIFVNKRAFAVQKKYDLSLDVEIAKEQQGVAHVDSSTTTAFGENLSTHQSGGSCASGAMHYLEIAVAYDNSFCALYENKETLATQALQGVVDKANGAYAKNTCVQLALVHVEAHCQDSSDPYKAFTRYSANQILNGLRQIWMDSRENVKRDAAYLITGFEDGTSVAGIAGVAAACNSWAGYGWVEGPSEFIFAHEVGHTLGGSHTATGIMGAVATSSSAFSFSSVSVQEFTSYLDKDSGSSCIETTKPRGKTPPATSPPTGTTRKPTSPPPTESEPTSPKPTEPEPTSPPPTKPTPPPASGKTCKSGFARHRALACGGGTLRRMSFRISGSFLGQLTISIAQRYGQYHMKYTATGDIYISKYRDYLTTESAGGSLGSYQTPSQGSQRVMTKWDADDMPIPSGMKTCCGKTLYIEVDVIVCVRNRAQPVCGRVSNAYTKRIGCNNVCRGDASTTFVPMSSGQRCPSCT